MRNVSLVVSKSDIEKSKLVTEILPDLKNQSILVRIEKFGLTANNVTYAVLGNSYKYFDFFPVLGDDTVAPLNVWGIGTVIGSKHRDLNLGEKIYGYFPSAQYLVLSPKVVTKDYFYVDRDNLPADRKVYNQYYRAISDPFYSPNLEDHMILFRPLFWTSFFLADYLEQQKFFDCGKDKNGVVVISSASSKTSFCLAFLLKKNFGQNTVGITSKKNAGFCSNLGCYNAIVTYENFFEKIPRDSPIVFVDVAGDVKIAKIIYDSFPKLKLRIQVGVSHWQQSSFSSFSEKDHVFFAPVWIKQRQEQLGENLTLRMKTAWKLWEDNVRKWVNITKFFGGKSSEDVYKKFLKGDIPPDAGYVATLFESEYRAKL